MQTAPAPKRHEITRGVKIALFLAFAPFVCLLSSIALKLPLPTFPFWNILGPNSPEHVIFMANRTENLPGSIVFAATCFIIGWLIIAYLALEPGAFLRVLRDLAKALQDDFNRFFAPETWIHPPHHKTDHTNK